MRRLPNRGPRPLTVAIAGSVFVVASLLAGVAYAASSAGTASLSMTPCAKAGATNAILTATITNKNASTGNKIGSIFLDANKTNFSNIQPVSAIVIANRSDWTPHLETYGNGSDRNDLDGLYLTANNSTSAPIVGGGSITVSFPAKIGTSTGAKTWTGTAWTGTNLNGSKFGSFSTTVNVKTSCATSLTFVVGPSSTPAGGVMTDVQVKAWDGPGGTGNPVAGETVKLTSTGLASSPTAVTNGSGIATFTGASQLKVGTTAAPNYTMTASDGTLSANALFNISAAAPNAITFLSGPFSTGVGGVMNDVTVKVVDAYNNPVNADPVALTSSGLATSPTSPLATNSSGQATFSGSQLTVVTAAGPYTMTASDGVKTSAPAGFNVTTGSAENIVFVTNPTDTVAGGTMAANVKVKVTDHYGNPVPGDPVYLSSAGLGSSPTGTVNTLADGTATFTGLLVSTTAGPYEMTASDGTHTSPQTGFSVLPGDPYSVTFDAPNGAQPDEFTQIGDCLNSSDCATGGVKVYVTDEAGNPVADGTDVTISIGTDPTGVATLNGVLNGSETNPTTSGLATFTDLKIEPTSSGYTLHADAGTATAVGDSSGFAISNTAPGCDPCTATFDNGTSTVSAPAGTVLVIETNLDCPSIVSGDGIAGTVRIVPPNDTDPIQVVFEDQIGFPINGTFPFCKTPDASATPQPVPFCNAISNGLNQHPIDGVPCVTESVDLTNPPTLHSTLWVKGSDPFGKH